ncbi:MAG: phosphodiester glycosidase family protein [Pyrinomonadaceae bacterium]
MRFLHLPQFLPLVRSFRPFTQAVLTLCALCVLCGEITAQDFKTLKPGVEYAEVTKEISGLKVNMNLLRLDLKKVRIDVHHAMDAAIGTEKTSSIATRHGAFAAINAGFFRLDTSIWAGDSAGILKIDGKVLSEGANNRVGLMIKNSELSTEVAIANLSTMVALIRNVVPVRLKSRDKVSWMVSGVNRERKSDELLIYTPEFGRTTLTNPDGLEIVVSNGKVTGVFLKQGSSPIPNDGFVISASGKYVLDLSNVLIADRFVFGIPGANVRSSIYTGSDNRMVSLFEDITNGVPQLIKNSKIDITWQEEKSSKSFVETRHPRTAVAKLKDGKFLMITVDGRTESSGGIGLQDLAEYLLSLGATDAMNLDGGGSTTMFVDGKVVNHPSDKEGERKVSDALLVTLRRK